MKLVWSPYPVMYTCADNSSSSSSSSNSSERAE
jgi:hypothetical protein